MGYTPAWSALALGPGAHMLRDWLIAHPEDRERYAAAKFASAEQINAEGGRVMDYNQRKATGHPRHR